MTQNNLTTQQSGKQLTVEDLKKVKGAYAASATLTSIKGEDASGNKQEVG